MAKSAKKTEKHKCGIVMPISAIDGRTKEHWIEVLNIIKDAVEIAEFDAELVSEADDVGVIPKRIVQNLYDNPIVVCDISAKNPNVMFELGLRLAFDKPTIVIADDETTAPFDINQIEYIEYPRSLRFGAIVKFKDKLAAKIKGTMDAASSDKNYTTFLKHFGTFTVAKLEEKEVSGQEFLLQELKAIGASVARLEQSRSTPGIPSSTTSTSEEYSIRWHINEIPRERVESVIDKVMDYDGVIVGTFKQVTGGWEIEFEVDGSRVNRIMKNVDRLLGSRNIKYSWRENRPL